MAWHSAGTYRVFDGRGGAAGGQQRFEPLNSWPDNASLDKARRLLWPIKKKYGKRLSWADLMVLSGNVALESMGFPTIGFAGGRMDDWEPDLVYWGPEKAMLARQRHKNGKLAKPLGATQMGLIYVNPEGPGGNPDPLLAAEAIRDAFGRMAMNDEETVALIAGGHSFGKAHGAHKVEECVGKDPAGESVEAQGLGWKNKCGKGNAEDTITSGLEGAWTATPIEWSVQYLSFLWGYEWKMTKSPAGATQWIPTDESAKELVPDAHVKGKTHAPIMFTTDIALKKDPSYAKISKRFMENPEEFEKAFGRAWFKLTHRDMGPKARYVGSEAPEESFSWQDPLPRVNHRLVNKSQVNSLKKEILRSGLSVQELVRTAWASASTFRATDMRGGADGARIRLAPMKDWRINNPEEVAKVLGILEKIQKKFNRNNGGTKISMADMIVLGGAAGVEEAARKGGYVMTVPFKPGRVDATQEQTDVLSFSYLEPKADAFRNYYTDESYFSPIQMMVDKAAMLDLSVPEMTVLMGGMRSIGTNTQGTHGYLTSKTGVLSNNFFVNLYDMSTEWKKSNTPGIYNGVERKSGKLRWTATPVDLAFGSSAELRAIGEVYASNDGRGKFIRDFISAWTKVMRLDRF
jgi:catalase-peroxidase